MRPARVGAIAALVLAGCGSSGPEAMPVACLGERDAIATALAVAPSPVVVADGTRLSHCVSTARAEGDLQTLGMTLTHVADGLRARAEDDPDAALQLGYLIGAVRRGAARTPGIAAQLARRVEASSSPQLAEPRPRALLERGIALGEAAG